MIWGMAAKKTARLLGGLFIQAAMQEAGRQTVQIAAEKIKNRQRGKKSAHATKIVSASLTGGHSFNESNQRE